MDGVWTPLYAPSLYFSFFLDKGLSFLFLFFLTCLSMWHTFFGYTSFIFFLHSPISLICFLRERCHTWTWSFILWMNEILLTSTVEAYVVEMCTWSWSWEYEMNLTKGHNNLTKLNEIASCICGRFCNENNIWLWIGILYHRGTLYFCVFKNKYSRYQASHKRRL